MTAIAQTNSETLLTTNRPGRASHIVAWVLQGLLGLQFLFAGAMKFVTPMEEMTKTMPLPAAFLYFIGVCEVLGGLGLILPGALKIRRGLTPLAAIGLSIIMAGAVVICARLDVAMASVPLIVGLLCGFVVWRRWSWLEELRRAS
ncbi:MAG TPA: DoxX family protein [Polyangiales bacterium]|nr:DoxX family protein [Polyangiales bacterium]